jgi:hypothetical protein
MNTEPIFIEDLDVNQHGAYRVQMLLSMREQYKTPSNQAVHSVDTLKSLLSDYQYAAGMRSAVVDCELHTKFGVRRLTALPEAKFEACGAWLLERVNAALLNPGLPTSTYGRAQDFTEVTPEAWKRLKAQSTFA